MPAIGPVKPPVNPDVPKTADNKLGIASPKDTCQEVIDVDTGKTSCGGNSKHKTEFDPTPVDDAGGSVTEIGRRHH